MEWKYLFSEEDIKTGEMFVSTGKAKKFFSDGFEFEATVRDDRNYKVNLKLLDDDDILESFSCSCGQKSCSHLAALMILTEQWLDELDDEYADDDDYDYEVGGEHGTIPAMPPSATTSIPEEQPPQVIASTDQVLRTLDELQKEEAEVLKSVDASDENEEGINFISAYRYFHTEKILQTIDTEGLDHKQARAIAGKLKKSLRLSYGQLNRINDNRNVCQATEILDGGGYLEILATRDEIIHAYCGRCGILIEEERTEKKPCVHIFGMVIAVTEKLTEDNRGDATDQTGKHFVWLCDEIHTEHGEEENSKPAAKTLTFEPVVNYSGRSASVAFRIGEGRLYKVKDLKELIDAMGQQEIMSFGKKTTMQMGEDRFRDETSYAWYQWMASMVRNERERDAFLQSYEGVRRGGSSGDSEVRVKDALGLYGARLDRFYELLKGADNPVEFTYDTRIFGQKDKGTLRAGETFRKLSLTLEPYEEEGAFEGVRLTGKIPHILHGDDNSYMIENGYLFPMETGRSRVFRYLIGHVINDEIKMIVGIQNLRTFYYKALPQLRQIAEIQGSGADVIKRYLPPEAEFVIYLDTDGINVMCRVDVLYGKQVVSLLDIISMQEGGRKVASFRHVEAEQSMLNMLAKYMIHYDAKKGVIFTDDEEAIFELVRDGVRELIEHAQVRATSRFRNLIVRSSFPVTMGVNMKEDLLELDVTSDELTDDELVKVYMAYMFKKRYYRLRKGDFIDLQEEDSTLEGLQRLMESLQMSPPEFFGTRMHLPRYRALYLEHMMETYNEVYLQRDSRFKSLVKEFKTVEDADIAIPKELNARLRRYQITGYRWMVTLKEHGFGGILADDMGLGKTLQAIAVILHEKEVTGYCKTLVVCPASLVFNWVSELFRFAPTLHVEHIAGTQAARRKQIRESSADVFVTSYDLLKRDIAEYEYIPYRFLFADEAQYIKNAKTAASKSIRLLHADTRFALTGTPIENRLSELWSIMDFLMPGVLYTYEQFRKEFEQPIIKGEDTEKKQTLSRMVSSFILRRLKKDVLKDLPDKLEEVYYAGMDDEQQKVYDAQVAYIRTSLSSRSEEEVNRNKIEILAQLMRIRQICCDPSLIIEDYAGGSCKKESCMELIGRVRDGGHKALVFSQFTSMLELLEEELNKEKIAYYKITGATPKERRLEMVNAFNGDDTPVFLISLKAGGTGLNLTGADVVIHYDPWWNAAVENQATDRAHRIGQDKVVTVYKLIVKDTIEERILALSQSKQQLAEDILGAESISSEILNKDDLMMLLG